MRTIAGFSERTLDDQTLTREKGAKKMTQSWMDEHENVSIETREIENARSAFRQFSWLRFAVDLALNLFSFFVISSGAIALFDEHSTTYAIVGCMAWGLGRLMVAVHGYGARILRMEMHLLTIHDSVEWTLDLVQLMREER